MQGWAVRAGPLSRAWASGRARVGMCGAARIGRWEVCVHEQAPAQKEPLTAAEIQGQPVNGFKTGCIPYPVAAW